MFIIPIELSISILKINIIRWIVIKNNNFTIILNINILFLIKRIIFFSYIDIIETFFDHNRLFKLRFLSKRTIIAKRLSISLRVKNSFILQMTYRDSLKFIFFF